MPGDPPLTTNNASLTLEVRYGGRRVLLPGDLERLGLSLLLRSADDPRFDVILAPHHGANEVEGYEPFARAAPRAVIMSCSRTFEVDETAALYRRFGAEVFRTCESGAVTVRISPEGEIEVSEFRKR